MMFSFFSSFLIISSFAHVIDKDKSDWILDFSALIEIEPSLPTQLEGYSLSL